jgi:hypothetical protein
MTIRKPAIHFHACLISGVYEYSLKRKMVDVEIPPWLVYGNDQNHNAQNLLLDEKTL